MPCSMNLSQLSSLKLASSSALLIASAIISSLRDLADMVEALHHMMSLISQSVSTAQFRGSYQYQYFSQDVQYLERTGTVTFDLTCLSYADMLLLLFKVNTIDVATYLSVSLPALALFIILLILPPADLVQTLMWLCFSASRLFSQYLKDEQSIWIHKLPLQAIKAQSVLNKVLSRQNSSKQANKKLQLI